MRKRVQVEILTLLNTVYEALQYMRTAAHDEQKRLPGDCGAAISAVVAALQSSDGGNKIVFERLRQYRRQLEVFFDASCGDKERSGRFDDLLERLRELSQRIAAIRPRKEIVFLPYKASMWDSLESIWRAAEEDKTCDAYVMPIPYYDRRPDHSLGQFHYEGEAFPEDVPITDYRDYDLAKRRPDVIYIHNPYDDQNFVTTVAPEFYSARLKKYTDCLVYVPYFIAVDDAMDETKCQHSGVYNADYVIVQSEKVKKIYEKYHNAAKILALGSPKIDQIRMLEQSHLDMPIEWKKIAKNRKLILYNTGLSELAAKGEGICRKLRYVFSVFKDHQDVCLLWRPHPLSEATIDSIRPEMAEEYQALKALFIENKIGIYDESADVNQAMLLSDAYYGDDSSLVSLYKNLNKPIMIQNEQWKKEKYLDIPFSSVVDDGRSMWFASDSCNAFFQMDLISKKVAYIGKFPSDLHNLKYKNSYLCSRVIKKGKFIYFLPAVAKNIVRWDTEKKEAAYFSIASYVEEDDFFCDAFLLGKKAYLLPYNSPKLLVFDVETGEINVYVQWYDELKKFVKNENEPLFDSMIQIGNTIWCPFYQGNKVVCFNLENLQVEIYEVGAKGYCYYSMCFDGSDFWLLARNSTQIVRWNPRQSQSDTYPIGAVAAESICVYYHGYVWLFQQQNGGNILRMDVKTFTLERYNQYPQGIDFIDRNIPFFFYRFRMHKGKLQLFPAKANLLLEIQGKENMISGYKVRVLNGDYDAVHDGLEYKNNKFFYENFFSFQLEQYLAWIAAGTKEVISNESERETAVGKDIHRYIRLEAGDDFFEA